MTRVCHVGLRLYRSTVTLSTPRAWQGCVLSTSLEEVHVHKNRTDSTIDLFGFSETSTIGYE